ncbi:hypothetical protein L8956_04130 [Peribacillus frigoritolerans]|uniref:hypothetical protein n=1 Tax=Peribacillus frigoritolerans TaxID=450367 RepID=UPI001EFCB0ED|nr:hypothetical protein [Peribacillus frigoritolerans]ULM97926.1 hypothetical protein L8956_04130 [Peribacillus frigoritolerans]
MINVNVEVDRKELEKLISEMDLYPNTKEVVTEYKAIAGKVEERQVLLQQQLDDLKQKHVQNMLDQETAIVAEIVYLKIQAKKMAKEMQIIDSLLVEAKKEKEDLMIHYYKVYRKALSKDGAIASQYDVKPVIDRVLSQTMAIIAEVGMESRQQYLEVFPDVDDLFSDSKVREMYPRIIDESFNADPHRPRYNGSNIVLESHEIESATSGRIPDKFKNKETE